MQYDIADLRARQQAADHRRPDWLMWEGTVPDKIYIGLWHVATKYEEDLRIYTSGDPKPRCVP